MRVTDETKRATERRILDAGRRLFSSRGFEATTTRDLAKAAGIATGTLFNYFESKESLATALVARALAEARTEFEAKSDATGSLEEALFLHVATGLRRLEPYRGFVGTVLETSLSPFAPADGTAGAAGRGRDLRTEHLAVVDALLAGSAVAAEPEGSGAADVVRLHLYWSLYVGVLAFWTNDPSPNQEDSLPMLDEAMRLFVRSLPTDPAAKPR